MPSLKIAVSLDRGLLQRADRLARRTARSRSGLISDLLRQATREARDREITEQLNAVFSRPAAAREQREMARRVARGERFGDDPW